MEVCVSVSHIQFDNQLYSRASYDFPVVVIGQQSKASPPMLTVNANVSECVEASKKNALLMVCSTIESWIDVNRNKRVTGKECK